MTPGDAEGTYLKSLQSWNYPSEKALLFRERTDTSQVGNPGHIEIAEGTL